MDQTRTLTDHQRAVLDALSRANEPQSAYALLDAVSGVGIKAPVQVYRALDKLIGLGFVHKVERLNAFIACPEAHHGHFAAFAICDDCGTVTEVPVASSATIAAALKLEGFDTARGQIELTGTCAACRAKN